MNLLYIALGSAVGGVTRWLLGGLAQRRFGGAPPVAGGFPFPVGTLLVNVSGSFLLGALAVLAARQAGDSTAVRLLLMVGFCGGYTTFSTFSLETVALLEQGSAGLAALNVLGSVGLACAGTFAGMLLMRAVLGRA